MNEERELRTGDVVKFNDDSRMTVEAVYDGGLVDTVWFTGYEVYRGTFPVATLTRT